MLNAIKIGFPEKAKGFMNSTDLNVNEHIQAFIK